MSYERENIRRMRGYVPGEQPDTSDAIKLNTNENPYPPADSVMAALRAIEPEMLRRYPSPTAERFRDVAAKLHGLSPENVIATSGGDELLRLAVTTFVEPGEPIGVAEPSYSLYPVLAAIQDCPVQRVPVAEDWTPPADFADRMNEAGVKLALLVNPHAPSGRLIGAAKLEAIAQRLNGVLLIDEAYVDFVEPTLGHERETVGLVRRLENVLLLRSLSKGYSLAGLRFGYGLGPAGLIEPMQNKTKDSYNTDAISQRLAAAALEDREAARQSWNAVRSERHRLAEELEMLGLSAAPSQANFLLVTVPGGAEEAARLYESLKRQRIFVRYFDQDRLRDKLRLTVGTRKQNDALLAALRDRLGD